jgi:rhodanese-related sulfurtransferase
MARRNAIGGLLALSALLLTAVGGSGCAVESCAVENSAVEKSGGPRELSVDELAIMLDGKAEVGVFDANGGKMRDEYGVIPGATLLNGAASYDLATTLPTAKSTPCVFYCSSTWCSAARTAAVRAQSAGYTDVAVLPVGIKGWHAAGKPTKRL